MILVLEENDGFIGGFEGECAVSGGVIGRERDLRVGNVGGGIEHAEFEAGGEEVFYGSVDVGFFEFTGLHGVDQGGIFLAAGGIGACFDSGDGAGLEGGSELVTGGDVFDGCAVRGDVAMEVPVMAEAIDEKHGIGTGGLPVDGVVGAHDGVGVRFGDGCAEGGEIGVFEVKGRDIDVGGVAG